MTAQELRERLLDDEFAPGTSTSRDYDVALWHEGTRLEPNEVIVDNERRLVILRCVER